ncbi:hypothetical protein BGZ65_001141, partial [Modicella reniformis]
MINRLSRLIDVQNCRLLITYSQRTAQNTKQAIAQKLQDRIRDENRIFVYDPMIQTSSSDTSASPLKDDEEKTTTAAAAAASRTLNNIDNTPGPSPKGGVSGFMEGRNPYEAMLALADKIVVTADSIAMTNEALATG